MRFLAIGLGLGGISVLFNATLPSSMWACLALLLGSVLLIAAFNIKRWQAFSLTLSAFFIGIGYTTLTAQALLDQRLPKAWEGQDIQVVGQVIDLPSSDSEATRFVLKLHSATPLNPALPPHPLGNLRLTWYKPTVTIHAGETWQLTIRAKRPNGFANQHGFDYERWLTTERIAGTGYVREATSNQRLQAASRWNIAAWRETIRQQLAKALPDSSVLGLMQGLAIADTDAITPEQWGLFRVTGTTHLLAISGLHIAMVAWLGLLPMWLVGWVYPQCFERVPAKILAAGFGVGFATLYTLLAGFNIPAQRTLIMIVVVAVLLMRRQRLAWVQILATAWVAVLLVDPLALLTVGFWLSFGAVSLVVMLAKRQWQTTRWTGLSVQLGIAVCMLPLTAAFFGMVSWVSPVTNLIAIPWITWGVVPLILVGLVIAPVWMGVAQGLWWLAAVLLEWLVSLLQYCANLPYAFQSLPAVPWYWLVVAGLGVLIVMLPRGVNGRWLGVILLLPLLTYQPEKPAQGEFKLSVLDVGQGSSAVIQTAEHTLVVDAGPKADESFDTGKMVVVPWLQAQGIHTLDRLLITHADNDHSGGAAAILAVLPVTVLHTNATELFPTHKPVSCEAEQTWEWDGVRFSVLYPQATDTAQGSNDLSCVVRVSNETHSVLLAADIEQVAEQRLVARYGQALQSEVLVVAHHGSQSSSSFAFLKQVQPKLALISSGYRNRYGHPHPNILKRLQDFGVEVWNTAQEGELSVQLSAATLKVQRERTGSSYWWRRAD